MVLPLASITIVFIFTLQSAECIFPVTETVTDASTDEGIGVIALSKDESLMKCITTDLKSYEFDISPNGTVYVARWQKTYGEEDYILKGQTMTVCLPTAIKNDYENLSPVQIFNKFSMAISMTFFFTHLLVFALVKGMHNLPGFNLASLCLTLFLSYALMMISQTKQVICHPLACFIAAVSTHFIFLSSFSWMFILAFDVFMSIIHATKNLRVSNKSFRMKRYLTNIIVSLAIPLPFSVAAVFTDHLKGYSDHVNRINFKSNCCFRSTESSLIFFAAPAFVLVFLNFCMFGVSTYKIFKNNMKDDYFGRESTLKKNYMVYCKLAVIMGVTCTTEVVAPFLDVSWLSYFLDVLNIFQGIFMFLTLTCNKHAREFFKKKILRNLKSVKPMSSPEVSTEAREVY